MGRTPDHVACVLTAFASVPEFFCPADQIKRVWPAKTRDAAGNPLAVVCEVAASNYVGMYGVGEPGIDGNGMFLSMGNIVQSQIAYMDQQAEDHPYTQVARQEEHHQPAPVGALSGNAIKQANQG